MPRFERLIRTVRKILPVKNWPILNYFFAEINTRLQDKLFGGSQLRINGSIDIKLAARFRVISERYEASAMKVVADIIKPGFTAIDVGANIGIYSLVMGKLVGNCGKVFSFEPATESFASLIDHIQRNGLRNIVLPYQLLVGDKSGKCFFVEEGTNGTNRIGGSPFQSQRAKTVLKEMITLDEFFIKEGISPDFIKIDVEGYEMSVLKGAHNIMGSKRCPILCELHPGYWNELGYDWDGLEQFLYQLGYDIFMVDELMDGRNLALFR
jgi:FkbM family methyltransferase